MKKRLIQNFLTLLLSVLGYAASAAVIPVARIIDWSQSGVPGGIPNRTTIFCDVTKAPYNAVGNDSTDNRAALQKAFNACPNGQVVFIPAGVYRVSGDLKVPSNITIRGAGIDQTVIKSTGAGNGTFSLGTDGDGMQYNPSSYTTTISSGGNAGANSISVASATGITVGTLLAITETNDPAYVSNVSYNGTASWVDGWNTGGTRARGQIVQVTGVSGSTINFTPALYASYTRSPWATRFYGVGCSNSGVENLTVYATKSGAMRNFYFNSAVGCWLYNVKGDFTDGDHVTLDWSFRCEVRHSYFKDAYVHTSGSNDNNIGLRSKSTACLIVDNIIERLHCSIITTGGAAGNVIAYNYTLGEYDDSEAGGNRTLQMSINANHGAHPQFNLFEGNITSHFISDSFWGTSSSATVFRNWITGHATSHAPYSTRGSAGASYELTQARRAVDIWDGQTSFSVVGNIIGDSTMTDAVYKIVSPASRPYDTKKYLWSLGYATTADGGGLAILQNPAATLVDHGNYDYARKSVQWTTGLDQTLPNSLFLTSKPAWFGSLGWPAFDPSNPNPAVDAIPAGYRYNHGADPSGGSLLQAPTNVRLQ
jgi:hypothetical protein